MKIIFECTEDEASDLLIARQKYNEAVEEHIFQERLRDEIELPTEEKPIGKIGFDVKGE